MVRAPRSLSSLVVMILVAGCASSPATDGASVDLGPLDPRCQSLCQSSDASCASDVADCEPRCQIRVAGMSDACATCLLDQADKGTCASGAPCCPSPHFPAKVLDCAKSCAGSDGKNPSPHPVCTHLCASSDPSCDADAKACLDGCEARIKGATGLCALCLLDGASGGSCASDAPCCPHPEYPTSAASCASICGG